MKYFIRTCSHCKKSFSRTAVDEASRKRKGVTNTFCSAVCWGFSQRTRKVLSCTNCLKEFERNQHQIQKVKNVFCSKSCAAKYNNTHKTHGTRRSKLEVYLEEQLKQKYPNLEIHFNRKDAINSELDIYMPSLRLAFELNGIYHYEPIHGPEKLASVQNNDNRKFQACLEKQIELCIIDTSKIKNFKLSKAKDFLDIITNIVDLKTIDSDSSKRSV